MIRKWMTTMAFALVAAVAGADTVRVGEEVARLQGAWPCYMLHGDGKWYHCPNKVEAGLYVLGSPVPEPDLTAEVEFRLTSPTLFYLDGSARCDGCYNVASVTAGSFALLSWDGSAWQFLHPGFADHVERCVRWTDVCSRSGEKPGPWTLVPGRYKLWVQSSDGTDGFRARTEIDIALMRVSEVSLEEFEQGLARCVEAAAAGRAQLEQMQDELRTLQNAEAVGLGTIAIADDLVLMRQLGQLSNPEHVLDALVPQRRIVRLKSRIALHRAHVETAEARCGALAGTLAALRRGKGTF